ncbi:endonuclease domain-containing protein [Rhodococcus sp. 06-235-1A]|uniref:endonuclease domain-containing protein n=1 Tax=Rhodococcus sp. 06-235-1A TaxID=2022508 RepID=UPI0026A93BFD|nr:DUF559 domain-containing protein [Rhodococcus sp. 06-235-1A]
MLPENTIRAGARGSAGIDRSPLHDGDQCARKKFYGDLVDFSARVIVEIDGREFHTDPATFDNDRRRQNELVLDGWLVLRYSAATALADLDRVVDEIITVVRRRRKSIAATDRRLP